ncbi:SPOR domain-containing protein, partial [Staphylococcus sp. SIMBA_130]
GFVAFISTTVIDKKTYYRVQAGVFNEKENADALVAKLAKAGFESFILIEEGMPSMSSAVTLKSDKGYKIQGDGVLTAKQMDAYARTINPGAPDLAELYLSHSKKYNI